MEETSKWRFILKIRRRKSNKEINGNFKSETKVIKARISDEGG